MNLKEYNKTDGTLCEGVLFFKTSSRIKRLISNLGKKIELTSDGLTKEAIMDVIRRLEKIKDEFSSVEAQYRIQNTMKEKHKIKTMYSSLEDKYIDLLGMLNKESVRSAIKATGAGAVLATIFVIMYSFFFVSGFSSSIIALKNFNPTHEDPVEKSLKELGSHEQKSLGDTRRGLADEFLSHKLPRKIEKDATYRDFGAEIGDVYSYKKLEREISLVSAGYSTLGVVGILGVFNRIFNSARSSRLFNATKKALEKL